jgi:STAS domain
MRAPGPRRGGPCASTAGASGRGEEEGVSRGPGERQGHTGRSRPGQDTSRAGREVAMGEALTIEARHERGYPVVTVAGEIDIATAARLRERLSELAAGGRPLVTDLDQVRFIDAGRRARRQPARGLRPAAGPPAVPADRAGPPASAGPHPGRGPGRRDDGPAHARLAGGSGGPDRRPGSRGGEDHQAMRSGKGRLPPPGPPAPPAHPGGREPWGRAGFRLCCPPAPPVKHPRPAGHRPGARAPPGPAREARHRTSQGNRPVPSRDEQALAGRTPGSRRGPRVVNRTIHDIITGGGPAQAGRRPVIVGKAFVSPLYRDD